MTQQSNSWTYTWRKAYSKRFIHPMFTAAPRIYRVTLNQYLLNEWVNKWMNISHIFKLSFPLLLIMEAFIIISFVTCMHAQSLGHVWFFCDSTDCSSPGSSVHGISQVRILEWVAISSSRRFSQTRGQTCVSYGS